MPKGRIASKPKAKEKPHSRYNHGFMYRYYVQKPKFVKNPRKTNPKGPRNMWIPKDKIVYVADILSRGVETPAMVPGL